MNKNEFESLNINFGTQYLLQWEV